MFLIYLVLKWGITVHGLEPWRHSKIGIFFGVLTPKSTNQRKHATHKPSHGSKALLWGVEYESSLSQAGDLVEWFPLR